MNRTVPGRNTPSAHKRGAGKVRPPFLPPFVPVHVQTEHVDAMGLWDKPHPPLPLCRPPSLLLFTREWGTQMGAHTGRGTPHLRTKAPGERYAPPFFVPLSPSFIKQDVKVGPCGTIPQGRHTNRGVGSGAPSLVYEGASELGAARKPGGGAPLWFTCSVTLPLNVSLNLGFSTAYDTS